MLEMRSFWLAVALIALGTFALRYSFILVMDMIRLPVAVQRMLRFIPASVLTALVVPAVVFHKLPGGVEADWRRMAAACLAAVIAWKTRNMPLTIATGMAALWGIGFLERWL